MATHRSSPSSGAGPAAFRGALVVIAAVVAGGFVLANVSGTPSVVSKPTSTTRPPAITTTVTTAADTVHDPASVSVLVLNAVDPNKAIAKPAATTLNTAGFATLPPRDAVHVVARSVVYFVAGYQPDAARVAAVFSIPPAAVVALPAPVPAEIGDPGAAQVVVVIGPDVPAASG